MKLRTHRVATVNGQTLAKVALPPAEPEIPDWLLGICGSVIQVDDAGSDRVLVSAVKSTAFEPFVADVPDGAE